MRCNCSATDRARTVLAGVVVVVACCAGPAAAWSGDAFMSRCQPRVMGMAAVLPAGTDPAAVCRCQAAKLAAQGYDPDTFHDAAAGQIVKMMTDDSGNAPDKRTKASAHAALQKMMQDNGAAFSACLPHPVQDTMQKTIETLQAARGGAR